VYCIGLLHRKRFTDCFVVRLSICA